MIISDEAVEAAALAAELRLFHHHKAADFIEAAAPHMQADVSAQVWDEAMTRAAEIAWEHDASASSAITTTPNPYRPTP